MKKILLVAILILAIISPLYSNGDETGYSQTDQFLATIEEHIGSDEKPNERIREYIENSLKESSQAMKSLVYAIACGDYKTADTLKNKVDLHSTDSMGRNILLFYATRHQYAAAPQTANMPEQLAWLINNGIDIDVLVYIGEEIKRQPDGMLQKYKRFDTYIEKLTGDIIALGTAIQLRPDLADKRNPFTGITPLGQAARSETSYGPIELLTSFGVDIDSKDINGHTPLIHAVLFGNYRNGTLLLVCGANPNLAFKHNDKEYTDVLDFLLHSPHSKNEDDQFARLKENSMFYPRSCVQEHAKKTLISLLDHQKSRESEIEITCLSKTLLQVLRGRFGIITESLEEKIKSLKTAESLHDLIDKAAKCNSLNEFEE